MKYPYNCCLCGWGSEFELCPDCIDTAVSNGEIRLAYISEIINTSEEYRTDYLDYTGGEFTEPTEDELWLTRNETAEDRYSVISSIRWIYEDTSSFVDWLIKRRCFKYAHRAAS